MVERKKLNAYTNLLSIINTYGLHNIELDEIKITEIKSISSEVMLLSNNEKLVSRIDEYLEYLQHIHNKLEEDLAEQDIDPEMITTAKKQELLKHIGGKQMLNKSIKFLGLLILVVSLAVTIASCDIGDGPTDGIVSQITSIEKISNITVEYGTEFEDIDLPENVEVTLDDNSTTSLDVNWLEEDYDGETADTYTIVGELELTNNIINPDNLYPTVQITVQEEGITLYTVSVDYDEDEGTVTGYGDYEEGDEVEVKATAKEGYEFVEWTGHVEDATNTITFDMPADDVELTVVFEEDDTPTIQHKLSLIGDNISSNPEQGDIEKGTEVMVTVEPAEGKQVATFIVNNANKIDELIAVPANQYIFTITEDTTIEVTYEDKPTDGLRTGMHLYGSDGVYLGKLTTNEFHIDSVFNEFGTYGSPYSQTSIWNQYGPYGSPYSDLSAFNDFANNPPEMYYKGSFVGYVTTNIYLPYSLHPLDLYSFLEYNGF